MSLKDDISGVKQELDGEEKFLTAFVKTERFVKKYKNAVLSLLSVIVLGVVSYFGYGYYDELRIKSANEAFEKLVKNPADKEALEVLKSKSTPLYEAFLLQSALKNKDAKALQELVGSKNKVVSDIASYEAALASDSLDKLASYSSNKDALYRDLALFVIANKYAKAGDYKKAKESLKKIPLDSSMKEYAGFLNHAMVSFE